MSSAKAPFPPALVLAAALLGISFAGPLVRLSTADPLSIAVWRLGFSLVIVAGFLLYTGEWREWRRASREHFVIGGFAGVSLALHFWSWNTSVHLTTLAASVTLVSLQPAFVLAISAMLLREFPTRIQVGGIAVALAGAAIIAIGDTSATVSSAANPTLGNALAILAALTAALYYSAGRHLRKSLGIWSYVGIVYTACFVTLLLLAVGRGIPLGPQPTRELGIFAGLALGPMLLGHTGMNWALRYMPAYVVNLVVLGEPIGATLLGMILPGIREIPPISTLIGGVVILAGVILTTRRTAPAS